MNLALRICLRIAAAQSAERCLEAQGLVLPSVILHKLFCQGF